MANANLGDIKIDIKDHSGLMAAVALKTQMDIVYNLLRAKNGCANIDGGVDINRSFGLPNDCVIGFMLEMYVKTISNAK